MANRLLPYIAALLLVLSLSFEVCTSQCIYQFSTEPGTSPDSPLDCNVIGADVTIECGVEGEAIFLGWYYTSNVGEIGNREGAIDTESRPRYTTEIDNGAIFYISNLVISSYNQSDNGYYWCEITTVDQSLLGFRNPSQVVHIQSRYTLDELEKCDSDIVLSSEGERCAFLNTGQSPTAAEIVQLMFIDIVTQPTPPPGTTTPPPQETTSPPTETTSPPPTTPQTPPPTTPAPPPTTPAPPPTTSEPDNVIRNALIGSSVAVVVILLVACGVIMCVVAIFKY